MTETARESIETFPEGEVELTLQTAAFGKYYAEIATNLYPVVRDRHLNGHDFEDLLRSHKTEDRSYYSFDNQTIERYVTYKNLSWPHGVKRAISTTAPKSKKREEFAKFSRSMTEFGADLMGQISGRAAEISKTMLDLAMVLDEPKLAVHFLKQQTSANKIDVYFGSILRQTASQAAVHEQLSNLRLDLEVEPVEYCQFLIREIDELGKLDAVDIEANAREVMALVADETIFKSDHDLVYDDAGLANRDYRYPLVTRYKLAAALIHQNQFDLADLVMRKQPDPGYTEPYEKLFQELEFEKEVALASASKLARKSKRKLRKEAADVRHGSAQKRGRALLILAVSDDNKRKFNNFYHDESGAQVSKKVTAAEYLAENPGSFYWSEPIPRSLQMYEDLFPGSASEMSFADIKRLRLFVQADDLEMADKLFQKIINNPREDPLVKLQAAVTMTGRFEQPPDSQIELEMEIAADMENLFDIPRASYAATIAEKSVERQRSQQDIEQLFYKITKLNNKRQELHYLQLLAEQQPVKPAPEGTIWFGLEYRAKLLADYLEARTDEAHYNTANLIY